MASDIQELSNLAVEVNNVVKSYGHGNQKTTALFETTIAVPRGCIYGLLGPSGCGKTTLLRCILGRVEIDAGYINTLGNKPGSYGHEVPGRKVGYMPQELALYGNFTVGETLNYFGQLHKMKKNAVFSRVQFLLEFLHLPESSRIIETLSGGQQRRVSFAVALLHRPELLILDEPTVGVDPILRQRIWEHLVDIARSENTTVIITTHYIEEARQADLVGLMRNGRLLAESSPQKLLMNYAQQTLEDVFLKLCYMDQSDDINLQDDSIDSKEVNLSYHHDEDRGAVKRQSLAHNKMSAFHEQKPQNAQVLREKGKSCAMLMHHVPNCGNIWALFIKNLLMLSRDVGVLLFEFFIPALLIIILCLCIGHIPFALDLAVVNKDTSHLSEKFLKQVDNRIIVQHLYTDMAEGYDSVKQGKTWGLITIGETFSEDLLNRFLTLSNVTNETLQGSTIHLYLDMADYQVAYAILTELQILFQKFSESLLKMFGQNPALIRAPIQLENPVYGELVPSYTQYLVPGFIACITIFFSTGLISYVFVFEKKHGLMDRSCVAGASIIEIMIGHIITQCVVMIGQVALLLISVLIIFQIPCNGSIVVLVILTLVQGLSGMALGLLISVIVDQEVATVEITLGVLYSNALLCGIIWPVQGIPYWIRYISFILPMTHGAEAMRSVMSRGLSITEVTVWRGFLVSIGSTVIFFVVSVLIVRMRKL